MIRLRLGDRVWALRLGDRLLDLADEEPDLGVSFACRSATCGTCRVVIVRGAEAFEAATIGERETLEAFGDGPEVRLCCQLRVVAPVAEVELRRLQI